MGVEIERKFLVTGSAWRSSVVKSVAIDQGYLETSKATVRVRTLDDLAFLTIKGMTSGITRSEWEYEIPMDDARQMLDELCGSRRLTKVRHFLMHGGHEWTIDVFEGELDGLVMAEVELKSDDENVDLPEWIEREVSDDPQYYNSNMVEGSI